MNSTVAQVELDAIAPAGPEHQPSISHWTHVITHLDPRFGGLSATVPSLSSQLLVQHVNTDIAAFCWPEEECTLRRFPELTVSRWPARRAAWLSRSARRNFDKALLLSDGVHIHGLWEASTAVAAHAARRLHKPYVVSAHGMLEPWALANKRWKKRLYSALVERANLDNAACLHALTSAEAQDYRRFGSKKPIALIPNGVDAPRFISPALFLNRFQQLAGKHILLFLGRIHFKKGLDILVESWAALQKHFPDAVLVLAGPDSENSRTTVETLISERGITDRILFVGMLDEDLKWSALAAAHCFVLPSYSEGLSVAVLEALSVGVPVIITKQCHLPEVSAHGAGWQIEATQASLEQALRESLEMSSTERNKIGSCGIRLARQRFSWPVVALQMAELYRWISDRVRPDSFELLEAKA